MLYLEKRRQHFTGRRDKWEGTQLISIWRRSRGSLS